MTISFDLKGKTAVVTGANTGLGQGISVALAQAGASIVGVGRSSMEETEHLCREAGAAFHSVQADLATLEPIERIVTESLKPSGRIDILVNNAGIIRRAPALEFGEEDWEDVVRINLSSLWYLSQAAARRFVEQGGGGKIINLASVLSFSGGIVVPSYSATKAAVANLTRALANEWASLGINVNAIAPSYFSTSMTSALRGDAERAEALLVRIPAGRWGEPEDLKGAVVYLASGASDYVHGATIPVDGGWLAR